MMDLLQRRVALTLVLLVASRGALEAQSAPDSSPPRRIVMPRPVEVPLLAGPGGSSRPVVEVRVNGHGPYRFLLETGAREIDLSRALVDSLHLMRTGGGTEQPEYHVDSITVGGASFQDMTVAALPAGVEAMGIAGVLGLPFYQNLLLTIDYPAQRVRFERDSLPAPNGSDILALTRVQEFWGIPISIAGRSMLGVLDTQAAGAIGIPPALADQLAFESAPQVIGRARGAFGTTEIQGGTLAGDVTIGGFRFPKPFFLILQLPPEYPNRPNIGTGVLEHFVMTLDQAHGRIRLARSGSPVITLPGRMGGRSGD